MNGGQPLQRAVEELTRRCSAALDRFRPHGDLHRLVVAPAMAVALLSVAGAATSFDADLRGHGAAGACVEGGCLPRIEASAAASATAPVQRDPDLVLTAGDEELPTRRMAYDRFAEHADEIMARIPSLEMTQRHFPASPMTRDVGAQKARIAQLDELVEVTVEGFEDLTIDMSRQRAFVELERYHERIQPRMFIVHWTGFGYKDVDHFVTSLKPYRVQFFLDQDAEVYQLFETDLQKPAHALGVNDFAQGVEIETGHYDGVSSPLFSYTPAQIEQTVYLAVEFLRRNDLPVDHTTLLGHYTADLIFTNPYYDPHQARFSRPSLRKFDPPQELMEIIVAKARSLDEALGTRP
jgi:hypothetical protein